MEKYVDVYGGPESEFVRGIRERTNKCERELQSLTPPPLQPKEAAYDRLFSALKRRLNQVPEDGLPTTDKQPSSHR